MGIKVKNLFLDNEDQMKKALLMTLVSILAPVAMAAQNVALPHTQCQTFKDSNGVVRRLELGSAAGAINDNWVRISAKSTDANSQFELVDSANALQVKATADYGLEVTGATKKDLPILITIYPDQEDGRNNYQGTLSYGNDSAEMICSPAAN